MPKTQIRTERLLLRAAEITDLSSFAKWFSDPESMKFWSTAPHAALSDTEHFLERMVNSGHNGIAEFAVCLAPGADPDARTAATDDLVVIGKAGLWDGKEIGYIFDRDHWRKGYAFEAIDAILKHVWTLETAPEAVIADVDPENEASIKLLLKLGFVETRREKNTIETHLGWRDSVYFKLKKPM